MIPNKSKRYPDSILLLVNMNNGSILQEIDNVRECKIVDKKLIIMIDENYYEFLSENEN